MADEPSPNAPSDEDVPSGTDPDTDTPPGDEADEPLAWSSMDLPGMDPADGDE